MKRLSIVFLHLLLVAIFFSCSEEDETAPESDISLSKAVSNETPIFGDEIILSIILSNDGPHSASGVVVYSRERLIPKIGE